MAERRIIDIKDADLSVPDGSLISISLAHSAPVRPNSIETTALGVLVSKYIEGSAVRPLRGNPYNHEDLTFIDGAGDHVLISRDEADKPDAKYVIVPFRFVMTDRRRAFAKNIVIVDDLERQEPKLIVDSLAVGSDPNFIPISASSVLGMDLLTYVLYL
jgi:hypothetical protein|nr:MAG TPA: hypothetical protein [Caudoviricetes sp.]